MSMSSLEHAEFKCHRVLLLLDKIWFDGSVGFLAAESDRPFNPFITSCQLTNQFISNKSQFSKKNFERISHFFATFYAIKILT